MASPDRNSVEPPYDDHLMFGDAEEHEESRGRPLLVLLGMIVIAAFASVIWVAYNQGIKQARDGQPPVLADDSSPARVVAAAGETIGADASKSTAQVQPDMAAPAPTETQLAPAPEEPQTIVNQALPEAAPPAAEVSSLGAGQIASDPAAQTAPLSEPAPAVPPAETPATTFAPPPAMTGAGGPLKTTDAVQPKPRLRIPAAAPAVPAPVTEGAPDSTVDTFARPRAGADAMAGLPAATVPSETAPPAGSAAPVDPLTPSSPAPSAAGAPRQLAIPVEPQPSPAPPPAELTAAPTVLPELGPPADVETPKAKAAPPPAPAKPVRPKVVAEAAPAPTVPKNDILDEPFSGQPTGQPTAVTAAAPAAPSNASGSDAQVAAVAPQAAEPAAVRPAAPAAGGFVVQLGSFMSDADAASSWARIKSNHSNTLDGAAPEIRAVDLGAKGTRYRLRVGAYSARGEASQICNRLKASGQDCVVAAK